MKHKTGILVGLLLIAFMAVASILIINSQSNRPVASGQFYDQDYINQLADRIDFSKYDPESVIEGSEESGELPEKIKGDTSAPVVIYEYADYTCPYCADMNTEMNRIYKDYDGKVAIVFRSYTVGHQNSIPGAAAANAAAIQGYYERYKNILFSEQSAWYRLRGGALENYLKEAFIEASDGEGNVEQFVQDMYSDAIAQKIAFDQAAGNAVGLSGTPHFRINGEAVSPTDLRTKIDELLRK